MNQLRPPTQMSFEGNVAENWKRFKQTFELYLTATGISEKPDKVRIATFLHVAGEEAITVFNGLKWDEQGDADGDIEKYEKVIQKFERYCQPQAQNLSYYHHIFLTRAQEPHETFDKYLTELTNMAKDCNFGDLKDTLISSRIVSGIRDDKLRLRLLRTPDLNLSTTINICRAYETTARHMQVMNTAELGQTEQTVHAVAMGMNQVKCNNCGRVHVNKHCPAQGKRCNSCSNFGHFSVCCPNKNEQKNSPGRGQYRGRFNSGWRGRGQRYNGHRGRGKSRGRGRQVHTVDETYEDSKFFVATVEKKQKQTIKQNHDNDKTTSGKWTVELLCNNKPVLCKIDTGAQANVMPNSKFKSLGSPAKLVKSKEKLISYSGHFIKTVGKATIVCERKQELHPITFHIVEGNSPTVLSANTCENELKIIKRVNTVVTERNQYERVQVENKGSQKAKLGEKEKTKGNDKKEKHEKSGPGKMTKEELLEQYDDVFNGHGCLKGEIKIQLRENVTPVIHPPRSVPIALKDKLKAELDRMESLNVITKQTEPTEWVNSLTTVIKPNGELRVCLDPRDLNDAIQRSHYPMNTIEKVATKLTGSRYFSKFDAKSGYWQMKLDEKSSEYCTFNTPFGRYRFLRAPFGINSIPEIFQARMSELFEDVDGVDVVMDDILVWGQTEVEHENRVKKVLEIARTENLKLNKDKVDFKKSEIAYLGHRITDNGLKIDPEKVKAVLEMPRPTDKQSLQRFLGMLTYVHKFIPDLAEQNAPLRELLVKGVEWEWTERHGKCYTKLCELLTTAPVLAFYDADKPLTLSVDASSKGLGATLIQDGKPIAYASRALTQTQQNYAQIEKELLAITFGCQRFNDYVGHRVVQVETDHKPLEVIFKKPLHKTPLRLQRMLLALQPYKLEVKYKKGKELWLADALSRAYLPEADSQLEAPLEVFLVKAQTPFSPEKFEKLKQETQQDNVLSKVVSLTLEGWPNEIKDCPDECKEYWNIRDELGVVDGVLFKCEQVVIPTKMRNEMLEKIHESHLGVVKCKKRAREAIFWPGMNKRIEGVVKKCSKCNENRKQQNREPMINHDIPEAPWTKVASDLFEYQGQHYLIVVDYYSKFPEVYGLRKDTRAQAVINAHKSIFSRHGIPREIVSDNGPQYASAEFRKFSTTWEFMHTTSSPRYPRSNGQAERMVQTVKNLIKKSDDPCYALLVYRTTPLEGIGYSPSQLLMGRRLNTKLPMKSSMLKPETPNSRQVEKCLNQNQKSQKKYFDKGTRQMPDLTKGDSVRVRCEKTGKWQPGIVKSKSEEPRSYVVKVESGSELRRNRQVIRESPEVTPELLTNVQNPDEYFELIEDMYIPVNRSVRTPSKIPRPVKPQVQSKEVQLQNNNCVAKSEITTRSGRQVKVPMRYRNT